MDATLSVELSNPRITVMSRADLPLVLTHHVADTKGPGGEDMVVDCNFTNPFVFYLKGEKLAAILDIEPLIQEALIHVMRANAPT